MNFIITAPADVLALSGANPSASTVLTRFLSGFFGCLSFLLFFDDLMTPFKMTEETVLNLVEILIVTCALFGSLYLFCLGITNHQTLVAICLLSLKNIFTELTLLIISKCLLIRIISYLRSQVTSLTEQVTRSSLKNTQVTYLHRPNLLSTLRRVLGTRLQTSDDNRLHLLFLSGRSSGDWHPRVKSFHFGERKPHLKLLARTIDYIPKDPIMPLVHARTPAW